MRPGGPSDPSTASQVMWAGIFCTAIGLVFLGYGGWAAVEELRRNGRLGSNSLVGLGITGGAGLMFLLIGGACALAGRRDRERAIAIRAATTLPPPPESPPWTPPPGVTDHLGEPLGFDADFFVPPPPEIGAIRTADTSLALGGQGLSQWLRVERTLAVGLFAGSVAWLLMKLAEPRDESAWWIGGVLCGWGAGLLAWGKERYRHACYYVGAHGVARFEAAGAWGTIVEAERFLFADAADVRVTLTGREHGWTDFRFDWLDADGRVVFQIAGAYHGHFTGRNPWTDLLYQWGWAAREAWRVWTARRPA